MSLPILLTLNENDKRIIICLLIVLIFVFVVVGYIALLIEKIMKKMSMQVDKMMYNVVKSRVINDSKNFLRVGRRMNNDRYFKKSLIGFLLLFLALLFYLIYCATKNNFSFIDISKGFSTLFFKWDFSDPNIYTDWFGLRIIAKWPSLINTPHFEVAYWGSYIIYPLLIVGLTWLLITTQAHMSRAFRIKKLSKSLFQKNLENENINNINNLNNQNNNINDSI